MIKVLGISDPLIMPTGFGRVAREIFTALPQDKFDLAFLSRGWSGSSQFPGIKTYAETRDGLPFVSCQAVFPSTVMDFVGPTEPLVLWSLMDVHQMSWFSHPGESNLSTPLSDAFLERHRKRIAWVSHFPIDGLGPIGDKPPRWTELVLDCAEIPVAMSSWAREICQSVCRKTIRFIPHGVRTDRFYPMQREKARREIQEGYLKFVTAAIMQRDKLPPEQAYEKARKHEFRMDDRFTIVCVMANRVRKYWWDVLRAFAGFLEFAPEARLIGLCGSRHATAEDMTPIVDCCKDLGLRLDGFDVVDPNVFLLEVVTDTPENEDATLRHLINCANQAILLGGGEGFGLPQLEAHACGIPCTVGAYSASVELAVDAREMITPRGFYTVGSNQIRRPIYSVKDVIDRFKYAYQNPQWCAEVGRKGVEQAQRLDWKNLVPEWVQVIEEAYAMVV